MAHTSLQINLFAWVPHIPFPATTGTLSTPFLAPSREEATPETESTPPPSSCPAFPVLSTPQVPSLGPTPTSSPLLFPRWGLLNGGASSFSLSAYPAPQPPCRSSQENDLSCWGVGAELEPKLCAHTHTLRQTAAAQAGPPSASLRRHLPSGLLISAPPAHPWPHHWPREVPLPHQKSSPMKKEKANQFPSWDCWGWRREKQGSLPGLKRRLLGYTPCSCQSELESAWVRDGVLCPDRN